MAQQPSSNLITVVCTGNICRSPMAERLLAHALAAEQAPLNTLSIVSAGVMAMDGAPATGHSITALRKVGLDLSDHVARSLDQSLINQSVAILCMTSSHCAAIESSFDFDAIPLHRFRDFMDDPFKDIPDPYGMDLPEYLETRDAIAEAIPSVVRWLDQLLKPQG